MYSGRYPRLLNDRMLVFIIILTTGMNLTLGTYWWVRLLIIPLIANALFDIGVSSGSLYGSYHSATACHRRNCGKSPFIMEAHEDRSSVPE
jgi:hypothetical protein